MTSIVSGTNGWPLFKSFIFYLHIKPFPHASQKYIYFLFEKTIIINSQEAESSDQFYIATYELSHWVKLFLMSTLGKLAFSSRTIRWSICEQKDTSSKDNSLQDSSNFLKEAGLTILVPGKEENKMLKEGGERNT